MTTLEILVQWDFQPVHARLAVLAACFPQMSDDERRTHAATYWSRLPVPINHRLTAVMARSTGRTRFDVSEYGTNQIGEPERLDRHWVRFDTWTSRDGRTTREGHTAASQDDHSPVFIEGEHGSYTSNCCCCYLNHSHTLAHHSQQAGKD